MLYLDFIIFAGHNMWACIFLDLKRTYKEYEMKPKCLALLLAIMAIGTTGAFADGKADPRVRDSLDYLDIEYSINSSGNYKVIYTMEDDEDRSHMVFVVSETETYSSVEIREVWSVAAVLDEYPDDDIIRSMMEANSTNKLGAWAIEEDDGEVWILYTAKFQVDLEPDELEDIMYFVAEICDEMELELVGTDEY